MPEIEPEKYGADALAESEARLEDSRKLGDEADEAFTLFTRHLKTNHWAEKARHILRGAA